MNTMEDPWSTKEIVVGPYLKRLDVTRFVWMSLLPGIEDNNQFNCNRVFPVNYRPTQI